MFCAGNAKSTKVDIHRATFISPILADIKLPFREQATNPLSDSMRMSQGTHEILKQVFASLRHSFQEVKRENAYSGEPLIQVELKRRIEDYLSTAAV